MRALTVDVQSSAGRILCCTIFRPGGRKLLAKGHILSDEDIRLLETEGMQQVWVTELEEGEIGEDEAVMAALAASSLRPFPTTDTCAMASVSRRSRVPRSPCRKRNSKPYYPSWASAGPFCRPGRFAIRESASSTPTQSMATGRARCLRILFARASSAMAAIFATRSQR